MAIHRENIAEELRKLSEFSKQINGTTDLDEVLDSIFLYFRDEFQIENIWLQRVDEKKNCLYTYKINLYAEQFATASVLKYYHDLVIPLTPEGGTLWRTYSKGRPLYMKRIRGYPSLFDQQIVERLALKSILQIPLIIQGKVIAIIITGWKETKHLERASIESMMRFGEQIAGAIYSSSLLQAVERERKKSDELLLNVLPDQIAQELKALGKVEPVLHRSASVLFTDFRGFTSIAEHLPPDELVSELDGCFSYFDTVAARHGLEKIKTIGDSYMCAGGIPVSNETHAVDCVLAALEIRAFMLQLKTMKEAAGLPYWDLRIGINTGPLVAGVIGMHKFAYDVWGDTVNVASRMESSGVPGQVNISRSTYDRVKQFFDCQSRGVVQAKRKGDLEMFLVERIKSTLAMDEFGRVPSEEFRARYLQLQLGAAGRDRA